MTAAALKPDLLTHLFATQREQRAKSDHAAAALSIVFHGGIVAALIWASTQLPAPAAPRESEPSIIVLGPPLPIEPTRADAGDPGSGRPLPGGPTLPLPEINPGLPEPVQPNEVWHEPSPNPGPIGPGRPGTAPAESQGGGSKEGFAVLTTLPRLLNEAQMKRELERAYPEFLRAAGIGGEAIVWLLLDENGHVVEAEVNKSSGHEALDRAALQVGQQMRFSPARNRDRDVRVWVSVPFRFTTR